MSDKNRIEFSWKRRPSEIRGYDRALYTTLDNGDYIRADYNIGSDRVRLYVEVYEDDGASYYAIITKGRVTVEKSSLGRSSRVEEKIRERSGNFSSIPSKDVLKLINGNYNIISKDAKDSERKLQQRKNEIEETRRKYFKQEELNTSSDSVITKKVGFVDILDTLAGFLITAVLLSLNQYSLLTLGAVFVIWGIFIGFVDIVIRNREPIFMKILFFIVSGSFIYVYSYFNF